MAREMKDSGIEWIGAMPIEWLVKKIKHSFTIFAGATPRSEKPEYWDGDISWITPADYKTEDKYVYTGRKNITMEGYKSCGTTVVPKGSVIFSKRAPVGTVAISGNELCTNQGCLACVPFETVDSIYYYYTISIFTEQFELVSSGTTFKEISANSFLNFPLPFPIYDEQIKISSFLDKKCAELIKVIEKTRESIEEYKKLKQAVITQAVTKGIRGGREMKDSGIEWIGEIPEDWEVNIVFQMFTQVKNKNIDLREKNLLSLSYGKIKQKSINTVIGLLPENFEGYNIVEKDDIVLRLTDLQNDHKSLRVGFVTERGIVTSAYCTIRVKGVNNGKYLYYYLHSFDIAKGFYGMGAGVRQGLNWDGLKKLKIIVPSLEEQQEIVTYLDQKCSAIDNLIAKKERYLSEIENYKKSLIYEYVTGKREVIETDKE